MVFYKYSVEDNCTGPFHFKLGRAPFHQVSSKSWAACLYLFRRLFCWAYFRGSLFLEVLIIGRNFAFQNGLGLTIKQLALTVHGLMFGRAYYRKDFCIWDLGGLFSGGLVFFWGGGGAYQNFTVCHKEHNNGPLRQQEAPSSLHSKCSPCLSQAKNSNELE